jgi:hypothetical protein
MNMDMVYLPSFWRTGPTCFAGTRTANNGSLIWNASRESVRIERWTGGESMLFYWRKKKNESESRDVTLMEVPSMDVDDIYIYI